jgi:hypothetical protein
MSCTEPRPSTAARPARPAAGSLALTAAVAAGLSAAASGAVYAVSVAAGVFPSLRLVPDAGAQMGIEVVLLVAAVAGAAGVGAYALVRRFSHAPLRTFLWIAAAVLVASFAAPFAIPGTTAAQALVLNLLHVVVAGVVAAAVVRHARG